MDIPDINGLKVEETEEGQYRITHETGAILILDIQRQEALKMRYLLLKLIAIQETCRDKRKLHDACKTYPQVSMFNDKIADLHLNNFMSGVPLNLVDTTILTNE